MRRDIAISGLSQAMGRAQAGGNYGNFVALGCGPAIDDFGFLLDQAVSAVCSDRQFLGKAG
jgi:hypothetical protein